MEKRIKIFNDLKVGDSIYVGFEKVFITNINRYTSYGYEDIYASNGRVYEVRRDLSDDWCCSNEGRIYTEKEAIVSHYKKELEKYEADFLKHKSYCEEQIQRAEQL